MLLKELVRLLKSIVKTHPEAEDAVVFANGAQVNKVGYSKRYKQARIKLD